MKILYASCGGSWIHRSASEMLRLGQDVRVYSAAKNFTNLPEENYKRCWSFAAACQPFFRLAGGRFGEWGFHALYPVWQVAFRRQKFPACDVVNSVMGFCSEPFRYAEKVGALKVLDAGNSHPTSYVGFWQRELDIWNPGTQVSVPRRALARCNQEIERADLILCPCKFVFESMLYNGIPESKLALNPWGVDLSIFTPRARSPAKIRFLFVGSLTLRKGVQYLIPAFERVRKELPDAELILCGGLHPDFRIQYGRWKHLFTHVKGLTHPQLAELMQSCTAFVFPSIEEGFGLVIAEAMGAGLPIIATPTTAAGTLVETGKEGILVPGRSPEAVYRAMLEVATQPEKCDAMGKAAAQKVRKGYSWADYGTRLLAIYQAHLAKIRK